MSGHARTLRHHKLSYGSSLQSSSPLLFTVNADVDELDRFSNFVSESLISADSIGYVGVQVQLFDVVWCVSTDVRNVSVIWQGSCIHPWVVLCRIHRCVRKFRAHVGKLIEYG